MHMLISDDSTRHEAPNKVTKKAGIQEAGETNKINLILGTVEDRV